MATALLQKYIWLVDTIYRAKRGITLDEINARWLENTDLSGGVDIPRQTFNRWKNVIEEMFGIYIECNRKNGYRYYIGNPDELEGDDMRSWLLDTFATGNLLSDNLSLKSRILIDHVPSGRDFLTTTIQAMKESKVLDMTYQGFGKPEHTYKVEPYCVKLFSGRWYVIAHSVSDDRMRVYSLDRVRFLSLTDDTFIYPKDFNPEEYLSTFFGIVLDESVPVQRIVIRAYELHANYLHSLPLHPSQVELHSTDEYTEFEYTLRPTYDFVMALLGQGGFIEVMSPDSLCATMKGWVKDMWEMYGKR